MPAWLPGVNLFPKTRDVTKTTRRRRGISRNS